MPQKYKTLYWWEWIIWIAGAILWVLISGFLVAVAISAAVQASNDHPPIGAAFLIGLALAYLWHINPDTWVVRSPEREALTASPKDGDA